MAKLKVTSA